MPVRTVKATLTFQDPAFEGTVVDDANRVNSITSFVDHEVTIEDLRGREDAVSLERNGFQVLRHASRCRDFGDEAQVREVYYPEIADLVKRLTGARHVACYGHIVRTRRPDAPPNARLPATNVHVDNDFETLRQMAQALAPQQDREALLHGRIMLINLWRPLATVHKHPLAVVDGTTVRRANLHPARLLASRAAASQPYGLNVSWDPGQRWYYLSAMQPDEVLAFRQIDTKSDAAQWAGHVAFEDPGSPADAPERQSIEIRTVAYVPWEAAA